jgi:aminoglycoside phosphotransferase family enzyme/predicted kinase
MVVEDQTLALTFLRDPKTHGEFASSVVRVETHISVIVLVGWRAFKLKRAVRLPYVDFSTAPKRLFACQRELELNRRTAPAIYRAVRRITREANGSLRFDGQGPLVDAVVEMVRFDEETLFDRMAARGALTQPLLTETARAIARFHADAAADHSRSGSAIMNQVITINEQALAETHLADSRPVPAVNGTFRTALARHAALLDARERDGKVRRCHGDLHLRNICLVDGAPALFDCIEFDEAMATIDVLYDLSFLLMDLWHRGLRTSANVVMNRYLDERGEINGLPVLPFFMACRALIRAHVLATQSKQMQDGNRDQLFHEARLYFDLSQQLLAPVPARLVVIGGLSGTGKSTLAAAIAEHLGSPPGARVLSSDRIRKRLLGVPAETQLGQEAYTEEVSERVYSQLFEEARTILGHGHSVIADAVFDRPADRQKIKQCAMNAAVPFTALWLEAPVSLLCERVAKRRGDPSDATVDIVRAQAGRQLGMIDWRRVAVSDGLEDVVARVINILDAGTAAPSQTAVPD